MTHFDLLVIGSGTGNSIITPEMADWSVGVVERGTFGGTCLNVGCIPTKMFVRAAEAARTAQDSSRLGVDAQVTGVRWRDIRDRVFGRIDPISEGGRVYRADGPGTTLLEGTARFTGPRELDVDGRTVTADRVVIATGAHAVVPDELGGIDVHTSDTVMRIDELPGSMAIVGGGYIAAEMAHIFSALGVDVHLVVRRDRMLTHLDEELSRAFTARAAEQWDLHLHTRVLSAERRGSGARLHLSGDTTLDVDLVLAATGREPSTGDLDAAAGGIELREDGRVRVDRYGRTSADAVWALGDCASGHQLKHVANWEGRAVAWNLLHPEALRPFHDAWVPAAVFSHPEIASVGLTEAQARDAGYDVAVKVQQYGDTAYGWALEDTTSFAKVVADRATGRLLGVHVIGHEAALVLQPAVLAGELGLHAHDVARGQYWPHPALSEVLENALLGLDLAQDRTWGDSGEVPWENRQERAGGAAPPALDATREAEK